MSSERLRDWDTFKHELTTLCMTGDLSTGSGSRHREMHSMQNYPHEVDGASYGAQYVDQVGPKGGGGDGRSGGKAGTGRQPTKKAVECYTCGWQGHISTQCPKNPKNADKDKTCGFCKRRGHIAKQGIKKKGQKGAKSGGKGGVHEVDEDPTLPKEPLPEEATQEVGEADCLDAAGDLGGLYICGLCCEDGVDEFVSCCSDSDDSAIDTIDDKPQETVQLALDTGSVVTVIRRDQAPQFPLDTSSAARGGAYRSASKHLIHMDGVRRLETQDGRILRTKVGDVSRNLMAACDLLDTGHRVTLDSVVATQCTRRLAERPTFSALGSHVL